MSESCGNPVSETGEVLMPRKPKSDTPRICFKCKTNTGNLVIRHSVYCKDCFTTLVSTKLPQALEPHINHAPSGPRRGALKPSGSLLVGFSGGLGSTVLLDLVHKIYCAKSESEELKGGKEHPRRNRVWKKIYVCYVERSDAYSETRDRTEQIREVVARYEGFEFIPVRSAAHSLTDVPHAFDLWRRQIGRRSACSSPRLPTTTLATLFTLTRLLLLYTAYSIGASHLVLGTPLTSMSISLVSSIAQGGGFVVPQTIQEEWIPPFVERVLGDSSWKGEVRLRDYPSTVSTIARTAGKLAPEGESGEQCTLCELPTQMSVRGWKARTSIRSFTDEASPVDDASSSLSLLSNLCYSCHTTLTSKSSRCTTTPSWDTQSEVHLLKWSCLVCTL
ncbi:hypothetical protein EDB89DRAFT_1930437 [Lactarius sanguifluus]|nr:hypothetical protein EDB89DRAFT_1930437 [Lactarius sanguifluus]